MTTPEPSTPGGPTATGVRWRTWLRAAWPHVVTATCAIAGSLAIQTAWLASAPNVVVQPTDVPAVATPTVQPTVVPPSPTATEVPLDSGVSQQLILDLRAEDDRIWTAIYLARAMSQVSDAETTLRSNDFEKVDQLLVAVDDSLALAYQRAADAVRDPIAQLRRDVGEMRDDLYLRPEGMDVGLVRLRETILALIEERQ